MENPTDKNLKIITLTTDFGYKDYSVSAIKATLYSQIPNVKVVDISHSVSPYDTLQASYIIQRAYRYFPKGTIHIIGVDSEKTFYQRQLAIKCNDHYFVGADNGILSFLFDFTIEIRELTLQKSSSAFPTLKVFVPTAVDLALGKKLNQIGKDTSQKLKSIHQLSVHVDSDHTQMIGNIIYIDHYGNTISNITRQLFEKIRNNRDFEIYIGGHKFTKIYNSYNEFVKKAEIHNESFWAGEAILLFNSSDNLELAVYKSNMDTVGAASTLLGVGYRDEISVYFK